jgi:hypothetical protein
MTKADFLGEVRYLTRQTDPISLLGPDLTERVASLFRRHPWVAEVTRVSAEPPRQLRVELRFRRPTLAVPFESGWRAVDETGVLLPTSASIEGLPRFVGVPKTPRGPAGTKWGDPEVERQARGAGFQPAKSPPNP